MRSLIRLGIDQGQAYAWSRTRMGGWAVAQSPILITTITLERLKKRNYVSMSSIYAQISPRLNEPLYTRPNVIKLNKYYRKYFYNSHLVLKLKFCIKIGLI